LVWAIFASHGEPPVLFVMPAARAKWLIRPVLEERVQHGLQKVNSTGPNPACHYSAWWLSEEGRNYNPRVYDGIWPNEAKFRKSDNG
jgi:hypothetical protein